MFSGTAQLGSARDGVSLYFTSLYARLGPVAERLIGLLRATSLEVVSLHGCACRTGEAS